MRARLGWSRLAALVGAIVFGALAAEGGSDRRRSRRRASCATPGSTRTSPRSRSTRRTSPSRRSIRSGPTAPPSGAGSAAARHRDRRLGSRRLGVPGRHPVLEGVRLRRAGRSRPAIIELLPGGRWLYAAYEWSDDGRDGRARARAGAARRLSASAGGGRTRSRASATAGSATRRRPLAGARLQPAPALARPRSRRAARRAGPAPGVDLADLVAAGLIVGLPPALLETPPRIAAANAHRARRARLHARQLRALPQRRRPAAQARARAAPRHRGERSEPGCATTVGERRSRIRRPGQSPDAVLRVAPGDPERSALAQRIGSRWAALQMPPLGTETVDGEAYDLIREWIAELDAQDATSQEARERGQ